MLINALHAARVKFNEALGSSKVRTVIKKKVRTINNIFERGDRVYWRSRKKKNRNRKWDGPGRVICQDGKIIFVQNGTQPIRVSINRLLKAGQEFGRRRERGGDITFLKRKILMKLTMTLLMLTQRVTMRNWYL